MDQRYYLKHAMTFLHPQEIHCGPYKCIKENRSSKLKAFKCITNFLERS